MASQRIPPRTVFEAVDRDDAGAAYELLKAGAQPDEAGPCGRTPLFRAYEIDNKEMAAMLMREGADPCLALADGRTPMHAAARYCQATGIILGLIIAGGCLLTCDKQGRRPLDDAAFNPSAEIRGLIADFTEKQQNAAVRDATRLEKPMTVSKPLGFRR